jgi:hypothetical protein
LENGGRLSSGDVGVSMVKELEDEVAFLPSDVGIMLGYPLYQAWIIVMFESLLQMNWSLEHRA